MPRRVRARQMVRRTKDHHRKCAPNNDSRVARIEVASAQIGAQIY
jgi:hypothetical protein